MRSGSAGGRIISICSCLVERVPYPGVNLYAMSKSALVGLTKGLARDLGGRGITAVEVEDGLISGWREYQYRSELPFEEFTGGSRRR